MAENPAGKRSPHRGKGYQSGQRQATPNRDILIFENNTGAGRLSGETYESRFHIIACTPKSSETPLKDPGNRDSSGKDGKILPCGTRKRDINPD
jgi:hypothetical protein